MSASAFLRYPRSLLVFAIVVLAVFATATDFRTTLHYELFPFFEWMETTPLGVAGKTWGAVFAVVQAFHLLAMALLGGSVLLADARLVGLGFGDAALKPFLAQCDRLFDAALMLVVLTGVFMACGVAIKIYYLPVYWYKMLALTLGVIFVYTIRRPVLRQAEHLLSMRLRRLLAVTSVMIWFSVAATGRWIGFSG